MRPSPTLRRRGHHHPFVRGGGCEKVCRFNRGGPVDRPMCWQCIGATPYHWPRDRQHGYTVDICHGHRARNNPRRTDRRRRPLLDRERPGCVADARGTAHRVSPHDAAVARRRHVGGFQDGSGSPAARRGRRHRSGDERVDAERGQRRHGRHGAEVNRVPQPNIENALQGKIPGAVITQNCGAPGRRRAGARSAAATRSTARSCRSTSSTASSSTTTRLRSA